MRRPAPFSTVSSNGDDPGQCGHVGDVIRTVRYPNVRGCTFQHLPLSPNDLVRPRTDRPPISSNLPRLRHTKRALVNAGACVPRLRHVLTARDRPHSTKWSRMVPVGASLSLVDFHGFARNRAKTKIRPRMNDMRLTRAHGRSVSR